MLCSRQGHLQNKHLLTKASRSASASQGDPQKKVWAVSKGLLLMSRLNLFTWHLILTAGEGGWSEPRWNLGVLLARQAPGRQYWGEQSWAAATDPSPHHHPPYQAVLRNPACRTTEWRGRLPLDMSLCQERQKQPIYLALWILCSSTYTADPLLMTPSVI